MDCVLQPPLPGRLAAVGIARRVGFRDWGLRRVWGHLIIPISIHFSGLKDKKSWSEPDLSALRCEKVWFKVVGGQL